MMTDRRALIVGINSYKEIEDLHTAVNDAKAMEALLSKHQDGTPNYDCRLLCDTMGDDEPITQGALRMACEELFADFQGDVVFYFSGHGYFTRTGVYLSTCDSSAGDWGLPMQELIQLADESPANDILIILDCCHSGAAGNLPFESGLNHKNLLEAVRENMTIIAASRASENALGDAQHGHFTAALIDALEGGAADHLGWVTASSMYAYVERRFGGHAQRPVYKSHATRVNVIRQCAPLIERLKLHELVKHFPGADYKYPLDPEHEPEDEFGRLHEPVNEEKVAIARLFKEYRDAGLLRASITGEQLFWTARRSHTVELTPRGREYWILVKHDRL